MADFVGVRFRRAGRVYYFDPAGLELAVNDKVVVKTSRGLELGEVVISPQQIVASELDEHEPLKLVIRKATEEDVTRAREFEAKEEEALIECGRLVDKFGLPMKLLSAQYNFDGSRLTIFFSAAERVDFRRLVRELAGHFKVRVELRQVGSRDEAKLLGGFGRCGRPLCCTSFLCDFNPVSIKMAKEQSLPLNPMRISGVCGRLLCCLAFEGEQYHQMKEKLPREGQVVDTPMGAARVVGSNPLKETVLLELESGAQVELPLTDVVTDNQPADKPGKKK